MSKPKIRWEKVLNDEGTGRDLTIKEFALQSVLVGALMIAFFVGFEVLL